MEKTKFNINISKQTMIFLGMLLGVFIFLSVFAEGFFAITNFNNILADMVIPSVFALGMGIIFSVGGFDLSLGHIGSISALIVAYMMSPAIYLLPFPAIIIVVIIAGLIGALSGLVVSRFGVSSFIVTLGMQFLIIGIRQNITGGRAVYIGLAEFKNLAGRTNGVSHLLISLLVIGLLCYFFMERTTIGRKIQFVGSNINASEYKGIDIRNITMLAFSLGGVLAGLGGILYAARVGTVQINSADSYLLDAITIAVLSKVLFGGKYKTVGIIAVALLISMIGTGMVMLKLQAEWVIFAKGFIILCAIFISKIK